MASELIAERTFALADQERFATISGDRNPMHMNALAARRTIAGFPAVHGIHMLLWGLDRFFDGSPQPASVASLKVSFDKIVHVDDFVQAVLIRRDERLAQFEVRVEGLKTMTVRVVFGATSPGLEAAHAATEALPHLEEPADLRFEQMGDCSGRLGFAPRFEEINGMFPVAVRVLGTHAVAALACSSYLVGMVCPGLHSVYGGLQLVKTSPTDADLEGMHFRVAHRDERFRFIKLAVSGGGWAGSIDAIARPEPAAQASMSEIASRLPPEEFVGTSVLVVGGSRGLGELVAKTAAAGGARVTITYAAGESDALRVQSEVAASGGKCDLIRYDVRADPKAQLDCLQTIPDVLYYFATPAIFRRKASVFNSALHQEFIQFYVTGLYDLYKELKKQCKHDIVVFYPSSAYIDSRPQNMTEYTMAKAAGEVLCADMEAVDGLGPFIVRRLPRLLTDQTATVSNVEVPNALDVMLPILRETHAKIQSRHVV